MSSLAKIGSRSKAKRKSAASAPSAPSSSKKNKRSLPGDLESLIKMGSDDVAPEDDEEILSDDPDVDGSNYQPKDRGYGSDGEEEEVGVRETAEEKRLRLAKAYLEEIEKEEKEREKDNKTLHDAVNLRLRKDDLEESGRLKQEVALQYRTPAEAAIRRLRDHRCHKEAVTCVAVAPCGRVFFTGSRDAGIVKWAVAKDGSVERKGRIVGGKRKEAETFKGHCHRINALAVSSDGKFLAAGDDSKNLRIWSPETLQLLHTFRGHRDGVTGVAFRRRSHTLFSCSADRAVKLWNLDEMSYIETLHGHQDRVTGIDAGVRERCITSGGRDGSVRIFKVVEESQLVFNAAAASTDAVRLINEEHFVTCGEDGHVSLWGVMKKKPLFTVKAAHGTDPINDAPRWISAIAPLPMSDLIATGSCDGTVRFWRCSSNFRSLEPLPHLSVSVEGWVNALSFTPDGAALVICVGREHRLGGWQRFKEAKNSVVVVPLKKEAEDGGEGSNGVA